MLICKPPPTPHTQVGGGCVLTWQWHSGREAEQRGWLCGRSVQRGGGAGGHGALDGQRLALQLAEGDGMCPWGQWGTCGPVREGVGPQTGELLTDWTQAESWELILHQKVFEGCHIWIGLDQQIGGFMSWQILYFTLFYNHSSTSTCCSNNTHQKQQ